jgi:hypothetical protein
MCKSAGLERLNRGRDGISFRSASDRYLNRRKPLEKVAGVRGTTLVAGDKHD